MRSIREAVLRNTVTKNGVTMDKIMYVYKR
jgi:hypothetical protein